MKTYLQQFRSTILFLVATFITSSSFAQVWEVGTHTMTFVDSSRGNRQIETQIFYPSDIGGTGSPMGSPSDKRFPLIVFGHDTDVDYANYSYLWERLVNKGFFLAFPKTEMGPNPNVDELAKDMAFIASQFVVMRFTPGSFYFFRYNLRACMMGHGTGGGAATLAMQYYPLARTYVSLAATETVPSAINAASLITKPSVVITGDEDCVSPSASNSELIFNNIDSDCKTYINMFGASHCHFAMDAGACTATEVLCTGNTANSAAINWNTTYLLISFLRYFMKDNVVALPRFEWKLTHKDKQDDWSYIYSCTVNSPRMVVGNDGNDERMARTSEDGSLGLAVYPNPVIAGTPVNLEVGSEEESGVRVMITNLMGQTVWTREITQEETLGKIEIPTHMLSKGNYFLTVFGADGRISSPIVVQ